MDIKAFSHHLITFLMGNMKDKQNQLCPQDCYKVLETLWYFYSLCLKNLAKETPLQNKVTGWALNSELLIVQYPFLLLEAHDSSVWKRL